MVVVVVGKGVVRCGRKGCGMMSENVSGGHTVR